MIQARLRIVGPSVKEIKNYYWRIEEAAHDLDVPEKWILEHLMYLSDRISFQGTWYFSPDDYHKLRELRDETI